MPTLPFVRFVTSAAPFRTTVVGTLACALCFGATTTARAQTAARTETQRAAGPPARFTIRAEFRERMESLAGTAYTPDRDDLFWLSRFRLTLAARPTPWLRLTGQVQDARVGHKDIGPTGSPFSAPADVRIAHVELGRAAGPLTMALGRQELAFGEQRLVGHGNWTNAARTFDAARVTARRPGLQVDGFVSSVVRIETGDWDRSGGGSQFHGIYASATHLVPRGTIEPYFLWRADRNVPTDAGAPGRLRLGTMGVRAAGAFGRFDYGLETVLQRGSVARDIVRARAQHVRLRTPIVGPGIRVVSEYNYASGDRAAGDGRRGTFDPLYPTPHDKYGLADQVGWRNVHHVRGALDLSFIPGIPVTAAFHSWWLASRRDGLYSPAGVVARMATGAPRRHVGHGIDVQASRPITSRLQGSAGYAYIHPGPFLKAATPGASFHALFLMLTVAVSAER